MYAHLCDVSDIEVILGAEGLIARSDDSRDGTMSASELRMIQDCISRGSREVAMRLVQRYGDPLIFQGTSPPTNTPDSVRDMAAILASHWVCLRRNNPPSAFLSEARRQVFEDLRQVSLNLMRLPDINDPDQLPFTTNFHPDGRYRSAKLRRIDATSTRSKPPGNVKSHPEWHPSFPME